MQSGRTCERRPEVSKGLSALSAHVHRCMHRDSGLRNVEYANTASTVTSKGPKIMTFVTSGIRTSAKRCLLSLLMPGSLCAGSLLLNNPAMLIFTAHTVLQTPLDT